MKHLFLAFVLLFSFSAQARYKVGNSDCTLVNCRLLNGVAGNAAAALRTFTVDTSTFVKLTLQVNYVWSTGTAVTMTCSGSLDQGNTYASLTSTSIAAGTGTVSPYVDSYAVTASANFLLEYDVRTYDRIRCVAGCTGCGANDSLTIYGSAARYKTNEEAKVSGQ
jgi:hypothetical protein